MTTGFRKKLDSILGHALVLVMAVMVVNVLWQVFSALRPKPSAINEILRT